MRYIPSSKPIFYQHNFDNPTVVKDLNKTFIKNRGYAFRMPKPGTPVLLIVSGGLDSTLLWFHLLHTYKLKVYPIFFQSSLFNKNNIPGERLAVSFFYHYFLKIFPQQVQPVSYVSHNLSFSLTSNKNLSILTHNWKVALSNARISQNKQNSTYLVDYPTRFARFMLSAYEYGLSLQAKGIMVSNIFFGVVPEDATIGREPTLAVLRSLNLYLCLLLGDWSWQVAGPVDKEHDFYFPKTKSIQIAIKHNLPIEKTWSCVRALPLHCGFCNACRYRHASFIQTGIRDKTTYLVSDSLRHLIKRFMSLFNKKNKQVKSKVKKNQTQQKVITIKLTPQTMIGLPNHIELFRSGHVYFVRNNKTEEVLTINKSGLFIMEYLEKKKKTNLYSIVEKVKTNSKNTSRNKIETDCKEYIKELSKGGFVQLKN